MPATTIPISGRGAAALSSTVIQEQAKLRAQYLRQKGSGSRKPDATPLAQAVQKSHLNLLPDQIQQSQQQAMLRPATVPGSLVSGCSDSPLRPLGITKANEHSGCRVQPSIEVQRYLAPPAQASAQEAVSIPCRSTPWRWESPSNGLHCPPQVLRMQAQIQPHDLTGFGTDIERHAVHDSERKSQTAMAIRIRNPDNIVSIPGACDNTVPRRV